MESKFIGRLSQGYHGVQVLSEAFRSFLHAEREKINQQINEFYKSMIESEGDPYLRKFLTYSFNFAKGPGRRLLPISLVNTFAGLSSERDTFELMDDIYKISIAIELLHISNLMIDDLVDNEDIRRGLPTFHKSLEQIEHLFSPDSDTREAKEKVTEYETSSAIYGGNLTALLGSRIILESRFDSRRKQKAIDIFLAGFEGITRGNLLDGHYKLKHLDQITLEDYLILSSLKRGKQLETAVGMGAILANARHSQMAPLMQGMNKLGIIEQLVNDVKGSFGDPHEKSIDADIKSGQCTILTVIAYQSADATQKATLNAILGNPKATTKEVESVRQIYRDVGALEFVKMYSNSLKNDVYNLLNKVYPGLKTEVMNFFNQLLVYTTDISALK